MSHWAPLVCGACVHPVVSPSFLCLVAFVVGGLDPLLTSLLQVNGGLPVDHQEHIKKQLSTRTLRSASSAQGPYAERERECCLLVLNLVSSTLPCIRQPGPPVLRVCAGAQGGALTPRRTLELALTVP